MSLSTSEPATVTGVIVSYAESPEELRRAVAGLLAQSRPPEQLLVVDNSPHGVAAAAVRDLPAEILVPGHNVGYCAAVNRAAERARGEYLLCLNPDAELEPGCLARLAAIADADPAVAVVGAQVLLAGGAARNAGANPLHPTGISPSGGYGTPREHGPPRETMVVSGACCLIRRSAFVGLGGLVERFFLYYDDVDLCWRARIAGLRVIYCPEAAVRHDYEFARNQRKWLWLERNRLFSVLSNYEPLTLALLAPLLLATEAGLIVVAAAQGWLGAKLRAYRALLACRGELRAHRRAVQATRACRDSCLLAHVDDRLDSLLLPAVATRLANLVCVPYMRMVRRALS